MEALRFDRLARAFVSTSTRRGTLGLGAAGLLGALGLDAVDGRKHKKKKCKKKCGLCQKCKKGKCKPKRAGTLCGTGKQCFANGECVACDVCGSGCAHATVEAAVAVAAEGATIQVCPGAFLTDLNIEQALTLVGAGSGKGGTVLRGGQGDGDSSAVHICPFPDSTPVVLRHLAVRGGATDGGGGGILCLSGEVTLEDVRIADNDAEDDGGGLWVIGGTVTLIDSHVTGNNAGNGGGIAIREGTVRLTAGSTVSGNKATSGRAGGIFVIGGTLEISPDSRVTDNDPDDCAGTTAC
jgi:hypothetical protein